jgi:hypothetical protein
LTFVANILAYTLDIGQNVAPDFNSPLTKVTADATENAFSDI